MTDSTKQIIKELQRAARNPSKSKLHVIPSSTKGGWLVVPDDSDRTLRVFPNKEEAISFARKYRNTNEVEVHKTDGTTVSTIIVK